MRGPVLAQPAQPTAAFKAMLVLFVPLPIRGESRPKHRAFTRKGLDQSHGYREC